MQHIFLNNYQLCAEISEPVLQHFVHLLATHGRHVQYLDFLHTVIKAEGKYVKKCQDMIMTEVRTGRGAGGCPGGRTRSSDKSDGVTRGTVKVLATGGRTQATEAGLGSSRNRPERTHAHSAVSPCIVMYLKVATRLLWAEERVTRGRQWGADSGRGPHPVASAWAPASGAL